MLVDELKAKIIEVDDWPARGITYFDTTPIMADPDLFAKIIDELAKPYQDKKVDVVAGIESRGLILAGALAYKMGCAMAAIRKKDKLPGSKISQEYAYEYSTGMIEINDYVIKPGQRVVLVDDILATGGTMAAAVKLIEKLKGKIIGISFIVEKVFLSGRERLKGQEAHSLVKYE